MKTSLGAISLLMILSGLQALPILLPQQSYAAESSASVKALSIDELKYEISDHLKRVDEFKFIEQEAKKLGVRAWLFGGTAAGYAHYVKWDLLREKGDPRFQPDRFDYDYTNIYRSTQDLDIVIDGSPQQAETLQNALTQKYPHLQGKKTAWEVRLLAQNMGDKLAILNNPDFMNQHTDSNSTGMIEITKPKDGELAVRDVRDWNSNQPHFLKDIHEGALHYYFSPTHDTTKFAKEGRNPPILSVIRYLTKAFQYELSLRPEDIAQIKKIIQEFDPKQSPQNAYVTHWIEKNAQKLIQNAVNIEYAWDTLEEMGLRKKLEALRGNTQELNSLAWWMNKAPLRTYAMGTGSGKTAKELGLDILAHETTSFLAYESITRAHTGDPNVLISRQGTAGETASFGDGFYARTGRKGARGTGLTIRFHLNPNAREGTDFVRAPDHDYIVVKNKSALKVIPESLNIGPIEYFQMLARGNTGLGEEDRGIAEKLKRRIESKLTALSEAQKVELVKIVNERIQSSQKNSAPFLMEWFSLPISLQHPDLLKAVIKNGALNDADINSIILGSDWKQHPELRRLASEAALSTLSPKDLRKAIWREESITSRMGHCIVETLKKDKQVDGMSLKRLGAFFGGASALIAWKINVITQDELKCINAAALFDFEDLNSKDPKACEDYLKISCIAERTNAAIPSFCKALENLFPLKALTLLRTKGVVVNETSLQFVTQFQSKEKLSCLKTVMQERPFSYFQQHAHELCR